MRERKKERKREREREWEREKITQERGVKVKS